MENEQKATEEEKKTDTAADSNSGIQSQEPEVIRQANAARERLVSENERFEANLRRQEELMAKQALGGDSAGPKQPEQPKQPDPKEFKNKFLKGEVEFPK